ncbi:MAG: hypothetical protein AAGD07_15185 [Planctomycetota bacterium]
MDRQELQPRLFPSFDHESDPDLSPEVVTRVILALAGIDPAILKASTPRVTHRGQTIDELRSDPAGKKCRPSAALAQDHRYALSPRGAMTADQFVNVWQDSRHLAGAQESTEVIKLARWINHLRIAPEQSAFVKPTDQQHCADLWECSPKVLFYLFRSATKRIDRDSKTKPVQELTQSILLKLMCRVGLAKRPDVPVVHMTDAMIVEAESYLLGAFKIWKVLQISRASHRRRQA